MMILISEVKDNDTIVVSDAAPNDSGTYECAVSSLADQTKEVQDKQKLTVFSELHYYLNTYLFVVHSFRTFCIKKYYKNLNFRC